MKILNHTLFVHSIFSFIITRVTIGMDKLERDLGPNPWVKSSNGQEDSLFGGFHDGYRFNNLGHHLPLE